jgi:hypothetical protein
MSARRSNIVKIAPRVEAARTRASKNLDAEARHLMSRVPESVARAIMLAAIENSVKPLLKLPPEWRGRAVSAYEAAVAEPIKSATVLAFRSPASANVGLRS